MAREDYLAQPRQKHRAAGQAEDRDSGDAELVEPEAEAEGARVGVVGAALAERVDRLHTVPVLQSVPAGVSTINGR